MRHLLATLLLFACSTPTAAPQAGKVVSLDVGRITVWLGMSKTEVLKACADAGYQTMDDKDHEITYIFTNKGKANFRSYSVVFKAERVTLASRSWYSSAEDGFDAMIGALTTLDGQKCLLSREPVNTPEVKMNRMLISCGSRSVLILKGTAGSEHIADVIERIGDE